MNRPFNPNDPNNRNQASPGGVVTPNRSQIMIGDSAMSAQQRATGAGMANRTAYQNDYGQANQSRDQQMSALDLQQQAAMGNAPSRAELLGQQMAGESLNAQLAGAASTRGGPMAQAAAQRQAANGAAAFQQQSANNIAAMRAGEMADARNAYMQGASGIRGQDLNAAEAQAQNENFQRQLNQQGQMGYDQMANDLDKSQAALDMQGRLGDDANWNAERQRAEQHWEAQTGVNQHATDRKTGLLSSIGGGVLNGVGGAIGGLLSSDPRSKTDMQDLNAPMGSTPSWMPSRSDVDFIKYGPNADNSALDDRYAQNGAPPAPFLQQYMGDQEEPLIPAQPTQDDATAQWQRSFGDPQQAVDAARTHDNAAEADKIRAGFANGGGSGKLGAAVGAGLAGLGGGMGNYGSSLLKKSDPSSKMMLAPMSEGGAVDIGGGGGITGSMVNAASTGHGNFGIPGMIGGGGLVGGGVPRSTMGPGGGGGFAISDPRAKDDVEVLPLYEPPGKQLHIGDDGRAFFRSESDDGGRAGASLGSSSSARRDQPMRASSGRSAPRRMTNDELLAEAERMGQQMQAEHDARMAQGPAVGGDPRTAPPAAMMDAIGGGKAFRYRPDVPGEDPSKQHFGTTTEDLKQTPMGASMVVPGGAGGYDAIDVKEAVGPTIASLGNLNQRLRALETGAPRGRRVR